MSLELIDARSESLTVSWPATTTSSSATRYVLEYRTVDQDNFEELSNKLTQPQARKRNMTPETSYFFRVAPVVNDTPGPWLTHTDAFSTLSKDQEARSMAVPKISNGGNHALVVSWDNDNDAKGYELQMRENEGGYPWKTIAAAFPHTEVKKKNLTSKAGYQFRVRPVMSNKSDQNIPFSAPSDPAVAIGLSPSMERWFHSLDNGTLLRSGVHEPVALADALGGKEFVLLYASAHWCPPCRKFTPVLANWYNTVKNQVEIVFLSADHDENGFQKYFATHPWLAVNYDDDTREQLMATIKVSGIPRLVVIHAETGKVVEDNAVGKPLDLNRWRGMVK